MAKTALITGVCGQSGAYLSQLLLERGYRVVGQIRAGAPANTARLRDLEIERDIEFVELDLNSLEGLRRTCEWVRPDEVYNLAGPSSVARSFEEPMMALEVNAVAAARLLEALRLSGGGGVRFFQPSTSEMFGPATGGVPQDESTPLRPRSPYAVAKAFAHWQTIGYRESYAFFGACGIMFNHESPLRPRRFVTRKITAELVEVKHGRRDKVLLGSLDVARDWGYAKDYADGMWRILQQDEARDYVLATGRSTTVRGFAERAAAALGMHLHWSGAGASEIGVDRNSGRAVIEVSPALFRPAELAVTVGDASRARAVLGWKPSVDIEGLISIMVEADERRVLENRPLE